MKNNILMPYSFRDIEKRLNKLWFSAVRQKWSHVLFSDWQRIFPVPNHWWKDISPWVEKKIIWLLGLTKNEFDNIK